ncbi:MAG: pilus assembly protein PilP [Deltaproteobacteria bacterium]|nr:MAG: pilus assembly protein PilP [Deltaproteobacteria bacterium]
MKRFALLTGSLVMLAALMAVLAGCNDNKPAQPAAPAAKTGAKPPAAKAPAPAAPAEAPAEVKFVYQVEGRRDPFLPLLAMKGKTGGIEFENPLEAYDLVQYQLKGVIIGFGEPKAMVVAPDGKSYILKKGVRIGKSNGVVREISRERILVEERYQDLSGMTHTNIQEIKVPKREGV